MEEIRLGNDIKYTTFSEIEREFNNLLTQRKSQKHNKTSDHIV